ncbi:MAG: quinone oxidoreductase [Actinobacteria bacterium]|nr:MAG: quinone oxidoreductase [Actinomycetota bacterium]
MRAIQVAEHGGPEVMRLVDLPDPSPGPGEVLVRIERAGVNFVDVYHRIGLYPMPLPFVPGQEGCGEVVASGGDVTDLPPGGRVAWTDASGSYAGMVTLPAARAVPVPESVPTEIAAAVMLQGLTAHYLVNDTFPLQPGDRCLVHAGAGGVGRLLIQMARDKGAEVFATVGSPAKAEVAREAGAHHVIDSSRQDFAAAVEAIAGRNALAVVYDGVGASTFDAGLGLLRPRGVMVSFGNASGPVPPVDPLRLLRGGSLYLTRPTLGTHIADTGALRGRSADMFAAIASGSLDVLIWRTFPLEAAAEAHRALEGRRTTGKVLLAI